MTINFSVTVVVATFGELHWETLAQHRAIPSAQRAGADEVLYEHGASLMEARNTLLDRVVTPWVVFLDADDELEPGYIHAMAGASGDVRVPRVRYVRTHARGPALMPRVAGHRHTCDASCLAHGNWIVIGACARTDLLRKVGGWREFSWSEDWDLWARCWKAGATILPAPAAVYRAHVRADSRNRGQTREVRLEAHRAIARANGLPIP
jgi:GT2 family glycosyltransferase